MQNYAEKFNLMPKLIYLHIMADQQDNSQSTTSPYKRIIPDIEDWPIHIISKNREQVIQSVVEETLQNIINKNATEKDVHNELAKAIYLEKIRVERPWKTDPPDDKKLTNE